MVWFLSFIKVTVSKIGLIKSSPEDLTSVLYLQAFSCPYTAS